MHRALASLAAFHIKWWKHGGKRNISMNPEKPNIKRSSMRMWLVSIVSEATYIVYVIYMAITALCSLWAVYNYSTSYMAEKTVPKIFISCRLFNDVRYAKHKTFSTHSRNCTPYFSSLSFCIFISKYIYYNGKNNKKKKKKKTKEIRQQQRQQ